MLQKPNLGHDCCADEKMKIRLLIGCRIDKLTKEMNPKWKIEVIGHFSKNSQK